MLALYEARVLLVWLSALYLARRELAARAAAEAAADRCTEACRRAQTSTGQVHTDMIAASTAMKAVDLQQGTEEAWTRALHRSEEAWARYERLNDRTGRTVPGLIATAQAWACAALLTWKSPTWAADLIALVW